MIPNIFPKSKICIVLKEAVPLQNFWNNETLGTTDMDFFNGYGVFGRVSWRYPAQQQIDFNW